MAAFAAWVVSHWPEITGALGALLTLAAAVTAMTPTPKDDEVVRKIVAWLSFLQPRTSSGTLKMPGTSPAPEEAPFGRLEAPEEDAPEDRRLDL